MPNAAACPAAPNPAFRQNQYGGSLGGAIKKNKTFFFGDYEGLRYAKGNSAALFSVPTYCERGLGKQQQPVRQTVPGWRNGAGGLFRYQGDEYPVTGSTTQPNTPGPNLSALPLCTTGSAPGTCLSPLGPRLFQHVSLAEHQRKGSIINNYTSSTVNSQNSQTWDVKVDQHFSDKDTLYARYTHNGEAL